MSSPLQAFAYARVSTEDQADSGLVLDAQIAAATAAIRTRGWALAGELVDGGVSGATPPEQRPALEALDRRAGGALVVARLDRITRSLLAWAALVERSRRRGWAIVAVDEGFDLSTASARLDAEAEAARAAACG